MTIDDENSVYVGGLPYDATEDSIRRVFNLYGQVVAVKIINDRGVGGKCYGFVTFSNPRSAVDAINDMEGRTVDGRVVKVNEVRTRGGRANFGRDGFRRNFDQRGMDLDRGRDRERDHGYDRERSRDRTIERSRDRDQDKGRGYDRSRDLDRTRDRFIDKDRGRNRDRDMENIENERDRNRDQELEKDCDTDRDQGKEIKRTNSHHRSGNKDKDQTTKLINGSDFSERHSRERPSESRHGDHDQVEEQLDISHQKLGELNKEISHMEELVEERSDGVSKLQEKSQKLEDALAAAKKLTSHRQKQLTKLHKCFLNMKEYGERLRSCEHELQSLVDSTMKEIEYGDGDGDGVVDGLLVNGDT